MTIRIMVGDVRTRLAALDPASVHCVVTSPPYFGQRDYGMPGQIGLEPTLVDYLATMVNVFRDVRRVLRADGTVWLNIGDSYVTTPRGNKPGDYSTSSLTNPKRQDTVARAPTRKSSGPLKPKDLMMVPARLAIALQDDGWYLRSDIIWHKRAFMPESAKDRPTNAHEHIFLLTKSARYFYDAAAVAESTSANLRNVWTVSPEPFPDAHSAVFPREIPRRCIRAGTSETGVCAVCGAPWTRGITAWAASCACDAEVVPGVVLDPFLGSGTSLLVADELGRDGIGVELNPAYATMAHRRIAGAAPLFARVTIDHHTPVASIA